MIDYAVFPSPIGELLLTSEFDALVGLYMLDGPVQERVRVDWHRRDESPLHIEVRRQLDSYFQGALKQFHLPINMRGTPFQKRVWAALTEIPYGATLSYGEVARRLGEPNASRAVGLANGRNPVSIIVPCHRVIGAGGKLVGYGGGLTRKKFMLDLEAGVAAVPTLSLNFE